MSIYRGSRRRLEDVHAGFAANSDAIDESDDSERYRHLRRATPVETLLPRTSLWLSEIPERFRPATIALRFPRIANLLCATWGDASARGEYLRSLLGSGGRAKRRGFPAAVLRELQTLNAVHLTLTTLDRSIWDQPELKSERRRVD